MYILGNNSLSHVSFTNISFLWVTCFLILLALSLREQKFLISTKSSLPIISFMDCAFRILWQKSLPQPRSSRHSPMLSCKSFIVSHFAFRSVIYFELIFLKGGRSMSVLFFVFGFFARGCPTAWALYVEKTVFAPLFCLCSFVEDQLTVCEQHLCFERGPSGILWTSFKTSKKSLTNKNPIISRCSQVRKW